MDLLTGVYRHYKGGRYLVLGTAHDADGGPDKVVYVPLYDVEGAPMAVRDLTSFTGTVTLPDGTTAPRFSHLGEGMA